MAVRAKKIIKRSIVSLSEAAEIGNVDNIVFDRQARVAALVIRKHKGRKAELEITEIGNVHSVGNDAVTINETARVEGTEKVEAMANWPNLRQLMGCRVITEGGTYLGTIRDLVLDQEARRITDFDLAGRGVIGHWRGDTIPATGHLRFGTLIVIVPNALTLKGHAVLEELVEPSARAHEVVLEQPVTELATIGMGQEAILATNPEVTGAVENPQSDLSRAA